MSERVVKLDEVELSVHFRITDDPTRIDAEYEIHAGFADVVEIPTSLVETVKTTTGVDIREESVRCGAEIRIVEDGDRA
jgi:hypothetical protein